VGKFLKKAVGDGKIDVIYYNEPLYACLRPKGIVTSFNFNDYYNAVFKLKDVPRYGYYSYFYSIVCRAIEKQAARNNILILTNSQYTRNLISRQYRVNKNKIHVTFKGVDLRRFHWNNSKNLTGCIQFLFIGSDFRRKGLLNGLKVVKKLVKDYDIPSQFSIVGHYSPDSLRSIEKAITQLSLKDIARIYDGRNNHTVMHMLQKAHLLLLPSYEEAFGVAILEAMACGVIPIVSEVGGIPEIIDDEVNGCLFDPEDIDGMCLKIIEIINEPIKYFQMVKNCRKTVSRFSINSVIDNIVKLLGSSETNC